MIRKMGKKRYVFMFSFIFFKVFYVFFNWFCYDFVYVFLMICLGENINVYVFLMFF